jgi:choline kinase
MKAIILAAGRGARLMPRTENFPKCLTELAGRPLIEHQVTTLRGAGVRDIVIVTGYQADMLSLPGTRQVHNPDWAETNMVESLFSAVGEFGRDMLVCYGDIVYEPAVLAALLAAPHEISIVVDRRWRELWNKRFDDPLSDAESLRLNADGCITDIGGAVSDVDEIEAQYMGLMRFRKGGIDALTAARDNWKSTTRPWMDKRPVRQAYMTDLLMEMILMGRAVHAVPVDGGWLEIDAAGDLEVAEAMVADGTIRIAAVPRQDRPQTRHKS